MLITPQQKYQQTKAQTASPAQLIIMLYDGAIRFTQIAVVGIEEKNLEKSNTHFIKAQAIINELIASLNFNYELSHQLLPIYEYLLRLLIEANVKKNKEAAYEVLEHLQELRSAWDQASRAL
ncbi:hypothetical protein TCA2_5989 [Paenibacillus sp. TCA20]|uniref:flagellar export chaperone FliS n=1 Tax=Paenibacillus sp. TCA20 TaxID=1499968 RepID=UPI0004D79503|nr:flagellar export chaperone FliS [Paenibacillus sp. TCA20]GAK43491.1 hypothetical protein TCA2_5989 [Paenibacillus sp. TCA20]